MRSVQLKKKHYSHVILTKKASFLWFRDFLKFLNCACDFEHICRRPLYSQSDILAENRGWCDKNLSEKWYIKMSDITAALLSPTPLSSTWERKVRITQTFTIMWDKHDLEKLWVVEECPFWFLLPALHLNSTEPRDWSNCWIFPLHPIALSACLCSRGVQTFISHCRSRDFSLRSRSSSPTNHLKEQKSIPSLPQKWFLSLQLQ